MGLYGTRRALIKGKRAYSEKVLGYSPIAYWPLWEVSGTTARCLVNSAQNGTYTGVTLNATTGPDGLAAGRWDGANDYVNAFSTTFRDAFDGTEMTLCVWVQMFNVGVWTDGSTRYMFNLDAGGGNRLALGKAGNNLIQFQDRSSVAKDLNVGGLSDVDWMHFAVTRSESADQERIYKDGSQVGATVTSLGTWTYTLAISVIGAFSIVPTFVANGYIRDMVVFDKILSPTQIADIATV